MDSTVVTSVLEKKILDVTTAILRLVDETLEERDGGGGGGGGRGDGAGGGGRGDGAGGKRNKVSQGDII